MKQFTRTITILFLLFSLQSINSCSNEDNPTIYDPDALRVAGKYKTVTYIVPSINDTYVDILAIGGYINIELFLDFTVKGTLSIPKTPELMDSGFEVEFEGSYIVLNDSLQFKKLNNILSHPNVYFIIKEDSLKADYGEPPYIIELKRF